jgi:hypothetical protein
MDDGVLDVEVKLVRDIHVLRVAESDVRHVYQHSYKVFF